MEDAINLRMRDRFAERMRDMGLPEHDIPGRVCRLMREVNGLGDAFADRDEAEPDLPHV